MRASVVAVALAAGVSTAFAAGRLSTMKRDVFACVSWAGWHDYTLASLTPRGAKANRDCPIRIPKGAKVEVVEDSDESGAATVKYRGKTWIIDTGYVR